MARLIKAITMLAVYLAWICGTTFIAISCHIDREHHTHCCAECECHHSGCDRNHLEAPHACNHDHSNKVILYDIYKRYSVDIEPIALTIFIQQNSAAAIGDSLSTDQFLHYERGVPIPPSPTLSRRGMRAPPIAA